MIVLRIFPQADGMLKEFRGRQIVYVDRPALIGCLAGGLESGKPSVGIAFELPDGRVTIAETSLALLLMAADAFRAVHGDPRE